MSIYKKLQRNGEVQNYILQNFLFCKNDFKTLKKTISVTIT